MGRFERQQAAVRFGLATNLVTRAPVLAGAVVLVAGIGLAGSLWVGSEPDAPAPAWDFVGAEEALAEGRLVLAQLGEDARAVEDAPTLAEVVDLPIRRVATSRITIPPEERVTIAVAPRRDRTPQVELEPAPDLEALLAAEPAAFFPAPAASRPVRYASLPEAAVPGKFAMRPPRLPLLARLEAPAPFAVETGGWTPAEPDHAAAAAAAATGAATADVEAPLQGDDPVEGAALVPHAPPPPRPASLPAPERLPSPQPSTATAAATAAAPEPGAGERGPPRTLAGLLRSVLGGSGMPGVTEAADGKTPTECLPEPLRVILADVAREFGTVELVSTEVLNTANHFTGSARHRFHTECEAADFRVDADVARVVRWLRGRPNVGGVAAYRNGVIHVDLDRAVAARLRSEAASR